MEVTQCSTPDPLVIIDRQRQATTALWNLLNGRSAFLFCGGPSANSLPLELLSNRGIFSLAVNNAAGHPKVKPQAFVCSDPPKKFSHSIWLDPGVMKFVPTPKLTTKYRGSLRERRNGEFFRLPLTTVDCPNTWGFKRYSWMAPDDTFFTTDGACWGNHQKGTEKTGETKTVCTMLLGIRLLRYLGASKIYLVGVDFRMTAESGYSFNQGRTSQAAQSNNSQYIVVNDWLCRMQQGGVFQRHGVALYNCYQHSGLRAFPHVPFEAAIKETQGIVETTPDLRDWYNPEETKP